MIDEELQARLALLSLLPPDSDEQNMARRALVLKILPDRPQEAINIAWGWWEANRDERIPEVELPEDAVKQLPGLGEVYNFVSAHDWCDSMLADPTVPTAWFVPVLRVLSQYSWPMEALIERLQQQPSEEVLGLLLSRCFIPQFDEELAARLLCLALPQADSYREALGDIALRSPLAHSRVFLTGVQRVLGRTEESRRLVRGVREARFILKLRLKRRTRRLDQRLGRVDTWLEAQPQTDFYRALRQEIRYFASSRTR